MKWEIGIDMYTLICVKWITNKNLLYKKNKIKLKKKTEAAKKKKKMLCEEETGKTSSERKRKNVKFPTAKEEHVHEFFKWMTIDIK